MSEVGGPSDYNRNLTSMRDQYERQKQELKDEYEDQLDNVRSDYNRKIQEEQHSGAAAVNHIQSQVKNNRESAESAAQDQEKIIGQTSAVRQDNLKRRQQAQETYFDQAKSKQSQWAS